MTKIYGVIVPCVCCGSEQTHQADCDVGSHGSYCDCRDGFQVCRECEYTWVRDGNFSYHFTNSLCKNRTQEEIDKAKIAFSSRYGKTAQNKP